MAVGDTQDREVAFATAALLQADRDLRRDWYGYELGVGELERFAAYVLDRRHLPTADLVNQVALAMLTYEAPMIAESVEEMASDEHIETLVRITLEAVAAAQEASAWTEEER